MVAETVKKREGKMEEEKRLTERAKGRNVKGWKGKNKKRGRSFDIISGDKHRLKDISLHIEPGDRDDGCPGAHVEFRLD